MLLHIITSCFLILVSVFNVGCTAYSFEKGETYCKETISHGHTAVNCSNQNLTFIPKIKDNVDCLIFSNNHLTNVTQETFVNISNPATIYELYIDHNDIQNITKDAFDKFSKLHYLYLSYNQIFYDNLKQLLGSLSSNTPLTHLEMSAISTVNLQEDLFSLVGDNNIQVLKVTNYTVEILDMKIFRNFRRLGILDIQYNRIAEIALDKNKYLLSLYIGYNNLKTIPKFSISSNESYCYFPKLELLSVKDNDIQYISAESLKCLRHLKKLNINGNIITRLPNNFLRSLSNIRIIEIMLPGTRDLVIEQYAFNSSSLVSLTLQFRYSALYIFQSLNNTFKLLPKLRKLVLEDISLLHLSNQEVVGLFSPLYNLRELHCFSCQISQDPKIILNHMIHLDKIDLQSNMIPKLSSETFKRNKKLRYLSLRYNQIANIDATALPVSLLDKLHNLDVSKNPFVCDCNLEWFITWLQSKHKDTTIARYPEEYICNLPKEKSKTLLSKVSFTYRECHPWSPWIWVTIIASPCVVVIVVVSLVLYRNRWNIKHYIYLIRKRQNYQVIDGNNFVYDAFVSYESEDSAWVRRRLLPVLEEGVGLKLCIHERDFQPGVFINDNIVTNMDKSRKMILILTNAFARSGWCMFELKIAHSKLIENESDLVVILLEKIDGRNMNHSLKCLFGTTTYLEWTEDVVGQELFWAQLKNAFAK